MPERFDFTPTVLILIQFVPPRLIAAQQLRDIVDAVDQHVDVAVVIEIAESAAAARHLLENARARHRAKHPRNWPLPRLRYSTLRWRVAGFDRLSRHFRIDVAVAEQDVRPAVIVEVQKADSPAEEARVAAQPGLKGLIVEQPSCPRLR